MATRIRLQRHGKKGNAIFHLVSADARAPRDGKFIEKLGTYNPNTNPATININFERSLYWVQTGAEMSETAKAILSYKGVILKNHLLKGILKGALTAEQVETKFQTWLDEKDSKITGKSTGLASSKETAKAAAMTAEKAVNAAKAKAVEAKNTPPADEVVEDVVEEVVEVNEEVAADVVEETPAAEETPAPEAPAAEETPAPEA